MSKTWILVADSSRARFFQADTPSAPLTEVETLSHPESRLHEQDLTSDLPGRQTGANGTNRHAMDLPTDPKRYEAITFSKEIARRLVKGHNDREYNQLILIAAPSFLGLLRDELNTNVERSISLQLDKNLAQHTPEDIRKHLPEYLPSLAFS